MKPSIMLVGNAPWIEELISIIPPEFAPKRKTTLSDYVNSLIEAHAALILLDADSLPWESVATTSKVNNATRRIPVVLVSNDEIDQQVFENVGVDQHIRTHRLPEELAGLLQTVARVVDPALREELDCQCQEPLPPLAQQGVHKFNAGEYYPQHDLFEEQWMQTEGPVRDLYRAILQVGVAYYQIERGNYRGALKMLQRSVQWLVVLPDTCQGVNVRKLREDSFRVRRELERLGAEHLHELDRSLLTNVEWDESA